MHDMCAAALAGDRELATKINEPLQSLHQDLFVEASPIPVKYGVHKMGYGSNTLRLPMTALSPGNEAVVLAAMKKANIL
jgi:4-hydroxy-tetrahydrodipicolinate synthase